MRIFSKKALRIGNLCSNKPKEYKDTDYQSMIYNQLNERKPYDIYKNPSVSSSTALSSLTSSSASTITSFNLTKRIISKEQYIPGEKNKAYSYSKSDDLHENPTKINILQCQLDHLDCYLDKERMNSNILRSKIMKAKSQVDELEKKNLQKDEECAEWQTKVYQLLHDVGELNNDIFHLRQNYQNKANLISAHKVEQRLIRAVQSEQIENKNKEINRLIEIIANLNYKANQLKQKQLLKDIVPISFDII